MKTADRIRPLAAAFLAATASLLASVTSAADAITVLFAYGSEKQAWVTNVTRTFNAGNFRTSSGKRIKVEAVPLGSGEAMEDLLCGRRKARLTSPASAAFVKLANAESQDSSGIDLIGETHSLVLSPVVIAMWKPMAQALGWGKEPVGWGDILTMANNLKGWSAYGFPQWGRFKFGHTHPELSNSGLISGSSGKWVDVHQRLWRNALLAASPFCLAAVKGSAGWSLRGSCPGHHGLRPWVDEARMGSALRLRGGRGAPSSTGFARWALMVDCAALIHPNRPAPEKLVREQCSRGSRQTPPDLPDEAKKAG